LSGIRRRGLRGLMRILRLGVRRREWGHRYKGKEALLMHLV
jgi:hypothetical protein